MQILLLVVDWPSPIAKTRRARANSPRANESLGHLELGTAENNGWTSTTSAEKNKRLAELELLNSWKTWWNQHLPTLSHLSTLLSNSFQKRCPHTSHPLPFELLVANSCPPLLSRSKVHRCPGGVSRITAMAHKLLTKVPEVSKASTSTQRTWNRWRVEART